MNTTEVADHDKTESEKDFNIPLERACQTRNRKTVFIATACILFFQMCERIVYYSVIANMVLFCTSSLDYDTVDATTITFIFVGVGYLMPIFGGYISDSHLGRFITILLAAFIIAAGLILLVVSSADDSLYLKIDMNKTAKRFTFLSGLLLIASGTGGIKANISPFGAEQVEVLGKTALNSFFNWFYWITSLGSVASFTGVAYIQQNISFFWGYVTPLAVLLVAVFVFVVAKPLYATSKTEGNAFKTAILLIWQGCCRYRKSTYSETPPENSLEKGKGGKLLDRARKKYGGEFDDITVSGVYSLLMVLPFCFLVIMFWIIFSQTQTSYFVQALRMELRIGDAKIPAAMLSSFTNISIVIAIPLLDWIVYPCLTKIGFSFTLLRKIVLKGRRLYFYFISTLGGNGTFTSAKGLGLILSTFSVVVAGVVEIQRKNVMDEPGGFHIQNLANENFTASDMSVFVQIPQFVLIGLGEIFTASTTLEMGYTQAPPSLQGLLTGLFYASSGVGNFLSMSFMLLIKEVTSADPWWGNEINDVKMENFMFLLACLMVINFIIFCVVAHKCKLHFVPTGEGVGTLNKDKSLTSKTVVPIDTIKSVDISSQSQGTELSHVTNAITEHVTKL